MLGFNTAVDEITKTLLPSIQLSSEWLTCNNEDNEDNEGHQLELRATTFFDDGIVREQPMRTMSNGIFEDNWYVLTLLLAVACCGLRNVL